MSWSHVLVIGLPFEVSDKKQYSFTLLTTMFGPENCVYVIDRDAIDKLSKPVPQQQAVLVGLTSRPSRLDIDKWTKQLGGRKSHVMLGDRVWLNPATRFTANNVAPNQHRIVLDDPQQVLWDVAVTDNYRKSIPVHHPYHVANHYRELGISVKAVSTVRGRDHRAVAYDASVELGDRFNPRSLVAIGRHSRFSGLLVPEAA